MDYILRFYHAAWLYFLIPIVIVVALLKLKWAKGVLYRYSLGDMLKKNKFVSKHVYKKIFFMLRFLSLLALALLIAKPQLVDPRSNILVEGIDMVIVLDMSGSMNTLGFGNESRFEVAKREALRFIEKREHDPIGLVIFGVDAISRCPITLDKSILRTILKELKIGFVDPRGTSLSTALLTAANRLKNSTSKNKIIIALTDGEPRGEQVPPQMAIDVAKKLGIKIYTIGIGPEQEDLAHLHPFIRQQMDLVNTKLLKKIATETGGKFFMAKSPKDMRNIYETIDTLEKTEYETDIYSKYFDVFMPYVWIVFIVLLFGIFLSTFIWFGI